MFWPLFIRVSHYLVCVGRGGRGGGGLQRGLGHNLLMRFSHLSSSKMEISEIDFFDIMTVQNDQISYVKHVLAPLCVFHIILVWGGGGLPKGSRAQFAYAVFPPHQLKNACPSPLAEVPCRRQ